MLDTLNLVLDSAKTIVDSTKNVPQTPSEYIMYTLTPLLGWLVSKLTKLTQPLVQKYAEFSAPIQTTIMGVISWLVVKLQVLVGMPLPTNPLEWNPELVNTVLMILVGMGITKLTNKKTI